MSSEPPSTQDSVPAAFDAGWLDVGHGHRVHYERSGNADGIPVVLLHGGPGSSSSMRQREFLDHARYHVIQFDQRGAGASTPPGETGHNHTGALIDDIEALRVRFGIARWLVAGGSWGSALALAYGGRHPGRVRGLLLRGIFLAEASAIDWFFAGVAALAPDAHAEFVAMIPRNWRRAIPAFLDRAFAHRDPRCATLAAAWQRYETRLDAMPGEPPPPAPIADALGERLIAKYRVQSHYLARGCFLTRGAVIRAAASLRQIPVAIVHGTNDRVCRPLDAWRLARACAGSRLAWSERAGHSPFHAETARLMRAAADAFARDGDFSAWPR